MNHKKLGRAAGLVTLVASLSALPSLNAIAEQELEEVVVTGSYIKRSSESSASPLSIVDQAQIDDSGIATIEEIVQNLTFNTGSTTRPNAFGDGSNGGGNINLRGLGLGSTLVLMNGRRQSTVGGADPFVNTATLVPRIAIQRIEIVKDGAAALYGTDAIAGVANFLTRDNFEGFEMDLFYSDSTNSSEQQDGEISVIFGAGNDTSHIMASLSYLDRGGFLNQEVDYATGTGPSGSGSPGTLLPTSLLGATDVFRSGFVPGTPGYAQTGGFGDLDCAQFAGNGSTPGAGALGGCGYDFSAFFPIVQEQDRLLFFTSMRHEFSQYAEVYGEFSQSNNEGQRFNSTFPFTNPTVLPAHHPGVIDDGIRRGLLDLTTFTDQNADGIVNLADASLAIQADPLGAGGSYDPAAFGPLRFIGRIRGGQPGTQPGNVDTRTVYQNDNTHVTAGLRGDLPGDWFEENQWTYDLNYNYSQYQSITRNTDTLLREIRLGFAGLAGPTCNPVSGSPGSGNFVGGNCFYFNPFGSGVVTPTGAPQTDPLLANTDDLYNSVIGLIRTRVETELFTVDAIATGDLFDLPNGQPVGVAVGLQYRYDSNELEVDDNTSNFNFSFISGASNYDVDRDVTAFFVEFLLPVHDTVEVQFAVRNESYGKISDGADSTDPKLSVIWTPTDDWSVRASLGSSFKVPSLVTLAGSVTQLQNTTDGTAPPLFIPIISTGNANLEPSQADVYNLGFSWNPQEGVMQGFGMDVDFYNVEYEDLVIREGFQDLVDAEVATRTIAGDASTCNPCNPQVVRNLDGTLAGVNPNFINANAVDASGVDFTVRYGWDTDQMGSFTASLETTYLIEYDIETFDATANGGLGGTVVQSGVGERNNGRSAGRSLPRVRSNLALSWSLDRHRVNAFVRYVHDYDNTGGGSGAIATAIGEVADGVNCGIGGAAAPVANGAGCKIDAWTSLDLQYNYEFPPMGFLNEGATLTLGALNVTDEEPPAVNTNGGIDTVIHDGRGPVVYGKIGLAF
ncbi:MAG: iron complex outermembrane receptor protein [Candidatus Azotimanducaceae bacterium]|jgi:iron complex outermembrane receptor protein